MLAKLFVQYALAAIFGIGIDDGYATLYGTPNDVHAGGAMACTGEHPVPQDRPYCAHRWLPCGTRIRVVNLDRHGEMTCQVMDRGPYGIDQDTARWRGQLDMSPGAAHAANLTGRNAVRLIYRLPPLDDKMWGNTTFLLPTRRGSPAL